MSFKNWSADTKAIVGTLVLATLFVAFAIVSFRKVELLQSSGWIIWLSLAAGGLGGIIHEFAQSGGKLLLTKREADGIYLGSLMGILLGMLAGVLAVQGLVSAPTSQANAARPPAANAPNSGFTTASAVMTPTPQALGLTTSAPQPPVAINVLYTAMLAGLGLKGIAEAVSGQSVSSSTSPLPMNARIPIDLPPKPTPPKLS
jgi:hypothetical protein